MIAVLKLNRLSNAPNPSFYIAAAIIGSEKCLRHLTLFGRDFPWGILYSSKSILKYADHEIASGWGSQAFDRLVWTPNCHQFTTCYWVTLPLLGELYVDPEPQNGSGPTRGEPNLSLLVHGQSLREGGRRITPSRCVIPMGLDFTVKKYHIHIYRYLILLHLTLKIGP